MVTSRNYAIESGDWVSFVDDVGDIRWGRVERISTRISPHLLRMETLDYTRTNLTSITLWLSMVTPYEPTEEEINEWLLLKITS